MPWTALRVVVEESLPMLQAMAEQEADQPYAPGKWTRKEVIGHLIDSASNNHGRFVRAQLQDSMRFEGYAQDDWVRVQRYREASWPELLALWRSLNLHLARVMEAASEKDRLRPRTDHALDRIAFRAPPSTPTLGWFMEDYVEHLRHHLRQILPEGRS